MTPRGVSSDRCRPFPRSFHGGRMGGLAHCCCQHETRRFRRVSLMGGTGLEPVTPSLSRPGRCSHPFCLSRLVTGVALRRTEPVRTRANASCSHCSHRAAITPTRLRRQYARARWRLDAALARRRVLRTQIADVRCRVGAARRRRVARRAALRHRSSANRAGRTRTSRARGSRRRCSSRPTRATVAGSPRR